MPHAKRATWFAAGALIIFSIAVRPVVAQIVVSDGWVRSVVAGQHSAGAFMHIKSGADVTLIGVASPAARMAEVHAMKFEGGMMKMRAVDKLPLRAGKTTELKPGDYHIMLMDLTRPLRENDTVPLTLTFEDKAGKKTSVEVKLPVRALASGNTPGVH